MRKTHDFMRGPSVEMTDRNPARTRQKHPKVPLPSVTNPKGQFHFPRAPWHQAGLLGSGTYSDVFDFVGQFWIGIQDRQKISAIPCQIFEKMHIYQTLYDYG